MTTREIVPAIGAMVWVRCEDLHVRCTVQDVKFRWRKPRVLVQPVAGAGTQWVTLSRCKWAFSASQEMVKETL